MSVLKVIFWGRGGEGVKTAAEVLGRAAFNQGLEVQAFPEYGPERSGAPVKAYLKISQEPIKEQASIKKADFVVVIDATLLQTGLRDCILNQKKAKYLINAKNNLNITNAVFVDASGIAQKYLGKDLPNIVLLGAFVKMSNIVKLSSLEESVKEILAKRPELLDANLKALKEAAKK